MIEILIFSLIGVFVGLIAGLLPGIHPNQIYVMIIALLPLLSGVQTNLIIAFIISVAISNVMFNYIPSIFFSVPDPSTVVNVLPGHRMVLGGEGLNALYISLAGAFISLIIGILVLPFLLWVIPVIHQALDSYLHILLLSLAIWMVLLERGFKKILAFLLFVMSGVFGLVTLNSGFIDSNAVLFPALTGMFGIAGLIVSAREVKRLPEQKAKKEIDVGSIWKIVLTGIFAGLVIGILPGIGESQAGVLVSQFTNLSQKEFLGSLAGINASNLLFSLVSLFTLGRIRSGVGAAISEITVVDLNIFLFIIGVILFSSGISTILTWFVGKRLLKTLENVNYELISKVIIGFTILMVFWLTGFFGLFVLAVSTSLGFLAIFWGVKRTSNMGYLMLPTIVYFAGLTHVINTLLF